MPYRLKVIFLRFKIVVLILRVNRTTAPSFVISSLPFEFGSNRTNPTEVDYYAFNTPSTPTVASYPFTLNGNGYVDASVESDFLRGSLRLALYNGTNLIIGGVNNYNQRINYATSVAVVIVIIIIFI